MHGIRYHGKRGSGLPPQNNLFNAMIVPHPEKTEDRGYLMPLTDPENHGLLQGFS